MKRLLLFLALALVVASSSFAQAPRRVLVEQFTSSTCPPCAATDPTMQVYEQQYQSKIVMLKWHVNWPSPGNDPYQFPTAIDRSVKYYNNIYAPFLFFDGVHSTGLGTGDAWVQLFKDSTDLDIPKQSPFTIDIAQNIVGDSIITTVLVKCISAPPAATDLRLASVVGERIIKFQGTNGLPQHDYVVHTVTPGLDTSGSLGASGAISMHTGDSHTYRYAVKIDPKWQRSQLFSAAFIQATASKEVFQSNWTIPDVTVSAPVVNTIPVPSTGAIDFTINNAMAASQKVRVMTTTSFIPSNWNVQMTGVDPDGTVTVGPNGNGSFSVDVAATGKAIGSTTIHVLVTTLDSLILQSYDLSYFGADNTQVMVDAGATADAMTPTLVEALKQNVPIGIMSLNNFSSTYNDWSSFKNIFYMAGNTTGIYSDNGDWDKLSSYLDGGGHFFVSSSVLVGVYYNAYQQTNDVTYLNYLQENFHIDPTQTYATSTWSALKGISGDPIGDGVNLTFNPKLSYRTPLHGYDNNFVGVFTTGRDTVGMRALSGATNTGKVVHFSFGLENLDSANRAMLLGRVLAWFDAAAGVKTPTTPTSFELAQNYPNPFNPTTNISYTLAERSAVTLIVRDMLGREVARLVDGKTQYAGEYNVNFDASKLASGTYMYTLTAGSHKIERKMTLTK